MNRWTKLSIEFANQKNYLDELYRVYPLEQDIIREIDDEKWKEVVRSFTSRDSKDLIKSLLALERFPIKNSYIAYLRRDRSAIERNPKTIRRIAGRLFDMGLDDIWTACSTPKETNTQIGPLFKGWLQKETLGFPVTDYHDFVESDDDAILVASDAEMKNFAKDFLNYKGEKGLDFVARINKKYVIGEAKFLTDQGGHQNAQFEDGKRLLLQKHVRATKIAILDGVLYIPGEHKMFKYLATTNHNIFSAVLLRDFLHQL